MSYQNTAFKSGSSTFADPTNNVSPSVATFNNQVRTRSRKGAPDINFVVGNVGLQVPFFSNDCDGCTGEILTKALDIRFNVPMATAAADLAALRAEVNRLFDKAIAEYNMTKGMVPPVQATFPE